MSANTLTAITAPESLSDKFTSPLGAVRIASLNYSDTLHCRSAQALLLVGL